MARFSEHETSSIYEAAAAFRDRCLLADASLLFPDASIWTAANLGTLHEVFVGAPDESKQSFEKFKEQVAPHGQLVTRLAAEVVAVHFLFPSNVSHRKRQLVSEVLSWGGDVLPEDHLIARSLGSGIGSGGQGFNRRRRFELYFLIELAIAWKKLTVEEARATVGDPWRFMELVDAVEGADGAQLRHMLLHVLFPDHFERIASSTHKQLVDDAFHGLLRNPASDLDRRIYDVRAELTRLLPGNTLDFYWSPLREAWYDESDGSGEMSPLDVLRHKKQIIFYGPPGTGKTYRAKALADQVVRSAAL